jgi:hypothetical protein
MMTVRSTEDVLELMKVGQKNRAVGATALNDRSSRSHRYVLTGSVKYRRVHPMPVGVEFSKHFQVEKISIILYSVFLQHLDSTYSRNRLGLRNHSSGFPSLG